MPSLLQAPGVSARFLDLLAREPLDRSRILDVGCGAGRLSLALAPAAKWVVGLEDRWRADGRWFRYIAFLESGGRTLTRSHLLVKARKQGKQGQQGEVKPKASRADNKN